MPLFRRFGRAHDLAHRLDAEVAARKRLEDELARARQQIGAANQAKSRILATIHHEIRTSMNGVLGMAHLLSLTHLTARQRQLLDSLSRSGKALLATTNDLLEFLNIDAGRVELLETNFDPRDVISELADLFNEACAAKGLELISFVAEDVPAQLRGDPVRLRQILINLVSNAVKFTDSGEIVVEITVKDSGTDRIGLALSVEDTGIGIETDERPRIFDPFFQADHRMTRARTGSGLGLAVAKHLVQLMGGHIDVDSEVGRGSCFRFTANFLRAPSESGEKKPPRHIVPALRVLAVDANAASRRVMAQYFRDWRVDAKVVATAGEAELAWIGAVSAKENFDVVIIDTKGLGTAGMDLARKVRSQQGRPADVICLVAGDSIVTDTALERLGVFATLTRPVGPSELFNCLASIAGGERRRRIGAVLPDQGPLSASPQYVARVLVAEDNAVNQEVIVGMLEVLGCTAVCAADGNAAVQLFGEGKFDLILMDCEMPVMDGFEAVQRIRAIEHRTATDVMPPNAVPNAATPTDRIPVVAVTAHALSAVRERCLAAGMDDFLVKPFAETELTQMLRRWLPAHERASS